MGNNMLNEIIWAGKSIGGGLRFAGSAGVESGISTGSFS